MPYPREAQVDCDSLERFDAAVALMRAGKGTEATPTLESLTREHPAWSGPWTNLGIVRLAAADDAGARSAFEQALRANPDNCAALTGLGTLERREGRFEAAEARYRACLASDPGFAPAHLDLAILYELYMGRLDAAEAAYRAYQERLVEPDPRVAGWIDDVRRRSRREDP
jgi:Flp pilus assembly protein TadD